MTGTMTQTDVALTALVRDLMPFTAILGLEAVDASPERVEAVADWAADRCTIGGLLHGGFLMAVADAVGASCAAYNLQPGASTTTIESKTNFFRGVGRGRVRIVATPLFVGSSTVVVQTDLVRDDGRLVSRTTQTQAVREARA